MSPSPRWQAFVMPLAVMVFYLGLAVASRGLFGVEAVGFLWIATGVGLTVTLLGGYRFLPALFLGGVLGYLAIGKPPAYAFISTLRHVVVIGLAIWLVRREGWFDPALRTLRDFLRLAALAAGVGVLMAATMLLADRLTGLDLTGSWSFHQRWTGHTLGIIVVLPLLLVWRRPPAEWLAWRAGGEAALILAVSLLVGQVVFLDWFHDTLGQIARGYWMFLFITWAAVRLGPHGVVLILAAAAFQGLLGAKLGTGFFADDIAKTHLSNYFFYMLSLTMTGMALATYFSEMRDKERTLEKYRRHLEELVRERTGELERTNRELISARDAAEKANRAKSAFLANMSHELRTPLNAILGFAQILGRDPRIPPDLAQPLGTIDRSGQHLLALINDVLEISRIEAGRITLHEEPFDLAHAIRSVGEMIRVRADARGLALEVHIQGELPPFVQGDGHHLRQVLINLLGNAVKFTDQGSIGLQVTRLEGDAVRFEVSDTGPGIAAEDQARLFEPFFQTSDGAAKGEGSGLGLAISRELVQLMGGALAVISAPGQGARFHFTLPLAAVAAPAAAASRGRVSGLEPGQPGYRVLVAEDHPDNRDLITRLLGGAGFQVRTEADGERAVAAFLEWHPHFIWMDMRMPVLDGYQATRRIRALPGGDRVHIAALTASAFREDRAAILAAGCEEMVHKPIVEERLFAVMEDLLGVHFRREEETATVSQSAAVGDLSALPQAVREELAQAAEHLDQEATQAIGERIRAIHPAEADLIARLVEDFRFDRLLALCGHG